MDQQQQRKRKPMSKRFIEIKITEAFGDKQVIFDGKADLARRKEIKELLMNAQHKGMKL